MKKRCRRKIWALVNPIQHAIEGAAITDDSILMELRTRELSAIEAFAKGKAGLQEWHDLSALLNVCEQMGRNGVGAEVLETCAEAQRHLIEAAGRFERTGKMGTTGPGIQSFRDLYEYHDLQRKSICRADYDRHIQATKNHLRNGGRHVEVIA